jgi:hypothetical protein
MPRYSVTLLVATVLVTMTAARQVQRVCQVGGRGRHHP